MADGTVTTPPSRRAKVTGRRVWTPAEVYALGVKTTLPVAGEIIGSLSETRSYDLYARGAFPLPVLAVGRKLFVPVSAIIAALGLPPLPGPGDRTPPADQQHPAQVDRPGDGPSGRSVVRQLRSNS